MRGQHVRAAPTTAEPPHAAVPFEQHSFTDFVTRKRADLVRYAALLTGSAAEAEDIVQDVLVRLVDRWDGLDDPAPYVWRSVTNEFRSFRRRWSTRNIELADIAELDRPSFDEADSGPDPELWAQLARLPRAQRAALVLRYYEGWDDDEIASALGCRPVTVRSHVHRGIKTMRTGLAASERSNADD